MDKAYYIEHRIHLGGAQRPTLQSAESQILQKFGPQTGQNGVGGKPGFLWEWDSTGRPVTKLIRGCDPAPSGGNAQVTNLNGGLTIPTQFPANCHRIVDVAYEVDRGGPQGLVSDIALYLMDSSGPRSYLESKQKNDANDDRANREKANGIKAPY